VTELSTDFIDLLSDLVDAEVDFLVVGGYAVAFYGHARATKDLDIFVRADPENAERLFQDLVAFGAPLGQFKVKKEDFSNYGGILQLGIAPQRIDIINQITGVTFEEALKDSKEFDIDGRTIHVIGLDALIKNKLAAGRDQDLVDAKVLSRKRE